MASQQQLSWTWTIESYFTLQLVDDGLVLVALDVEEVDAGVLAARHHAHAAPERHDGAERRLDQVRAVQRGETLLQG